MKKGHTSPKPSFRSLADRRDHGRQLRTRVGRADQGMWAAPASRGDPVTMLLALYKGHLRELLPIKLGRMAANPFAFFRGAAPLMASDLVTGETTGLYAQLCGDAHVLNLGAYAAPDGRLVFDLNDFDETILGPWEWDVKRLATSLILAGTLAEHAPEDGPVVVRHFVQQYRERLRRFSELPVLRLLKLEIDRLAKAGPVARVLRQAERAAPAQTLAKLTVPAGKDSYRFHDQPPLLRHVPSRVRHAVLDSLHSYQETLGPDCQAVFQAYRPVDVAFKVVGTGSVGTRDYVVLFVGNSAADVLFLQIKQALPSCYARYLPDISPFSHQGRRVAEGQRRLQTVSDPLLGWTSIDGNDFVVRQLADHKAAIEPKALKGRALLEYATVCGDILAKAHARTSDAAAIAGYCGSSNKLDKAMARFALTYAEQTRRDHAALRDAIHSGRVHAAQL